MNGKYKLIVLWDIDGVLVDVDPDAHKELRREAVERFLSNRDGTIYERAIGNVPIDEITRGTSFDKYEINEKLFEMYGNVFDNVIPVKDDETVEKYVVEKLFDLCERAYDLSIPFGDIVKGTAYDNEEMRKELMKTYGQVIKEKVNSIKNGASKQIFYPTELGKRMRKIRGKANENIRFGILSSGNEDVQQYKLGLVEGRNLFRRILFLFNKDLIFDEDLIYILPDKSKRISEISGKIKEKYPNSNIILFDDNEGNARKMPYVGGIGIKVGSEPGDRIVVSDTMFEADNWVGIKNGFCVLDKSKIDGALLNNLYALLVKE